MMTAEAIVSTGRPVRQAYGMVKLEISKEAVDLSRGVPVLDSHRFQNGGLGHVADAWIEDDVLKARLVLDDSRIGRRAYEMIIREEINGISPGLTATDLAVLDADGTEIDVRELHRHISNSNLTFIARRWQLLEVSIVTTPADCGAIVRAIGDDAEVLQIRRRMQVRQRSLDPDDGLRRIEMPDPRTILYGNAEPFQ
jgi:Caudovirus prohead serine protease